MEWSLGHSRTRCPMTKTDYLKRYRFPLQVMVIAIILHIFLKSRDASILLHFLLRAKVSHKTICDWTNKFYSPLNAPPIKYSKKKVLICHVDEKFIKVNGIIHYWWSLKDSFGNIIHKIITPSRDLPSAKRLLKEARVKIDRDVDILIRDGLPAYGKATKYLGRKCKSIISGINGKGFLFKKKFYWKTNNPIESLNSEIDAFLPRFQYNFASLHSAEKYADIFMLHKHLRRCFDSKKFSEASSMLVQAITI